MANYTTPQGLHPTRRDGLIYESKNGYTFKLELRDEADAVAMPTGGVTLSIRGSDGLLVHENLACDIVSEVITCKLNELLDYDMYALEWTASFSGTDELIVQQFALVAYPYFELWELSTFIGQQPDVDFDALRDLVEMRFEDMCKCVFRPGPATLPWSDIVGRYTPDVRRACILLATDLLNDRRPDATSEVDGYGVRTTFVVGGTWGNLTSVPEVNEIINRIGQKRPVVG